MIKMSKILFFSQTFFSLKMNTKVWAILIDIQAQINYKLIGQLTFNLANSANLRHWVKIIF